MKWIVTIVLLFLFVPSIYAADVYFPQSTTNELTLKINNNASVTAFNLTIDTVPTEYTNLCSNKFVYMYQGNMVVYSLNAQTIPSGDVARLKFGQFNVGTHTIKVTEIKATNGQAVSVSITGGDGVIAITFLPQDVHNTFMAVVNPSIQGIDVNKDGVITIIDGQLAANNQ